MHMGVGRAQLPAPERAWRCGGLSPHQAQNAKRQEVTSAGTSPPVCRLLAGGGPSPLPTGPDTPPRPFAGARRPRPPPPPPAAPPTPPPPPAPAPPPPPP